MDTTAMEGLHCHVQLTIYTSKQYSVELIVIMRMTSLLSQAILLHSTQCLYLRPHQRELIGFCYKRVKCRSSTKVSKTWHMVRAVLRLYFWLVKCV